MKKVLIIGYFWPYKGGSARMLGLAKYLPEFGWEPTIITAPLNTRPDPKLNFKFVETRFDGDVFSFWRRLFGAMNFDTKKSITEQIKQSAGSGERVSWADKIRTLYQEIFAYPDTEKKWLKPATVSAVEVARKEKFDAILSVWPVTAHLVAKKIKQKLQIPWVADFPDPWSTNHFYPYGKIRKFFDTRLEKQTLKGADAITTISKQWARREEGLLGRDKVYDILNGFDPEQFDHEEIPVSRKFSIVYTGKIYPGKQDPIKILLAIRELLNEDKISADDLEIKFYGEKLAWLEAEIDRTDLGGVAKQYGPVSKQEALVKQYEAQILLLLGWEDQQETGVYPAKIFEYLIARRPILLTGGSADEDLREVVAETGAGVSATKVAEIKKAVLNFYQEYKKNGVVVWRGDKEKTKKYSHKTMAQKFAAVFNGVIGKQNGTG